MRRVIIFMAIVFIGIIFSFFYNSYTTSNKYELAERCGKTAEAWFKQRYGSDGPKVTDAGVKVSGYTNHYNRKLNKCFVSVGSNYFPEKKQSSIFFKELRDINENKIYGSFRESGDRIDSCSVSGKYCYSEDQWNLLIKPYMEE